MRPTESSSLYCYHYVAVVSCGCFVNFIYLLILFYYLAQEILAAQPSILVTFVSPLLSTVSLSCPNFAEMTIK